MTSVEVITREQVELMRQIYVENLNDIATIPLEEPTPEGQWDWWSKQDNVRAWLYYDVELIGFSMLTDRGTFKTPIMAVRKQFWGKGYSTSIVNDYIKKADSPLAGSQLKSNKGIRKINERVGWQVVKELYNIELLYHPGVMQKEVIENYLLKKYGC